MVSERVAKRSLDESRFVDMVLQGVPLRDAAAECGMPFTRACLVRDTAMSGHLKEFFARKWGDRVNDAMAGLVSYYVARLEEVQGDIKRIKRDMEGMSPREARMWNATIQSLRDEEARCMERISDIKSVPPPGRREGTAPLELEGAK